MNDLNVLKSMLSGIRIERDMLIRRTNKTEDDKNDLKIDELQIKALESAISALSADGEYIKKADILNELGDVNMDILTDEVKEIVNGLPSYSFPDSAENRCFDGMTKEMLAEIKNEITMLRFFNREEVVGIIDKHMNKEGGG